MKAQPARPTTEEMSRRIVAAFEAGKPIDDAVTKAVREAVRESTRLSRRRPVRKAKGEQGEVQASEVRGSRRATKAGESATTLVTIS